MKWLLLLLLTMAAALRTSAADSISLTSVRLPAAGDYGLIVLSPRLLELTFVHAPAAGAPVAGLPGNLKPGDFRVTVDGRAIDVARLGFKRRALYAPLKERDLRVTTFVYLELGEPLLDAGTAAPTVRVNPPASDLWPRDVTFEAVAAPDRFSPALHVNQEGYAPEFPKTALVGYYLGTLGELRPDSEPGFALLDAVTGERVFSGRLLPRRDVGFAAVPKPYQAVLEANFSAFKRPGRYRLLVPGLGVSSPFAIDDALLLGFTRAYSLGLYHQRCGCALTLPFTRFVHAACHTAPAEIPAPASAFRKAWDIIAKLDDDNAKSAKPVPQLKQESGQLFPFVRKGRIDTRGGHHDAGDYSKYTTNSATLVHTLMFAVDALPGVAELDNLGLPESGDGVSDVLQEAKWEADFLAKLQDDDGGFYFLVYPKERRYEAGVTPDRGDPQIVWPKNTAATAAAVAALMQCASSPTFQRHFPADAKRYRAQAERGWNFLTTALQKHGDAAYQRLTHYGDQFQHADELAWAAAEMFVATGDTAYEAKLRSWYPNPSDPSTHHWNFVRASYSYGAALRAYAFATRSGRLAADKLDTAYLSKCEAELKRAGDDALRWSQQSAYGTSYPEAPKRQNNAGWYFASDQAFDMTVAYQLRPRPEYLEAVLLNLNFEAGCNPNNVSFITGVGLRQPREIVHQFAQSDRRVLPPTGIPIGSLQGGFDYIGHYKTELRQLSLPADDAPVGAFPLYDRWADAYNVSTEFVINNQARSLASLAFWAAQSPAKTQPWKPVPGKIVLSTDTVSLDQPVTARLETDAFAVAQARVVWEARDQEPALGETFTFTPRHVGPQWIEAEAHLPDGRRVFASTSVNATSAVVQWVDGAVPKGATPSTNGGDRWTWLPPSSRPAELSARDKRVARPQHESAAASGIHEHGFNDAEASLFVEAGDVLFAYVFLDPKNPPKTVMLEWSDGKTWEHRAFWGANLIPYGKLNTGSQRPMGALPPVGQWVRLEVPARAVDLEGREVKGMVFRLHGGRAVWDVAGKRSANATMAGTEK